MPQGFKYGARPRAFDPRFPHFSALRYGAAPNKKPPSTFNYAMYLPDNLGVMGNDRFGDCAWAALYHAIQLWSHISRGVEITEPDALVLQAYHESTGFNPDDPNTDHGTVLQAGLKYAMTTGLPIEPSPAPRIRHEILAAIEVDPRNMEDIAQVIWECGVAYIGFTVPLSLDRELQNGAVPDVWDWQHPGDSLTNEGHAIILTGVEANGNFNAISWGSKKYSLTPSFVLNCVTEVYGLADPTWVKTTGQTPLGLSVAELEQQMKALVSTP